MGMSKDEYSEKMKALESKRKEIMRDFAVSNAIAKIGDTIEDCLGEKTLVAQYKWVSSGLSNKFPHCIYCGPRLKKDGTPFKNGEQKHVYESDIKKINGRSLK